MAPCTANRQARGRIRALVGVFALAVLVAGCNQEAKTEPPQPRPVRTVTVEKGVVGEIGGAHRRYPRRKRGQSRLPHRRADHRAEGRGRRQGRAGPGAGETRSAGRTQCAPLGAGGARRRAGPGGRGAEQFRPSEPPHGKGLHHPGEFRSGESGADDRAGAGRRRDRATRHQPGPGHFTELKANVSGTITARTAKSGEVVQAGQPIFTVARQDGRDAVFDVPAQVLRAAPATRRSRSPSPTTRR